MVQTARVLVLVPAKPLVGRALVARALMARALMGRALMGRALQPGIWRHWKSAKEGG